MSKKKSHNSMKKRILKASGITDAAAAISKIISSKNMLSVVKTLAKAMDANDRYTRGHCGNVMKYSLEICKRLKLPGKEVVVIKTASLLHDIGKIGLDLSIIRKPGKLTEEEWHNMRMHPEIGARIVEQAGFSGDIVPIIKYHHSRYGGGGYPDPDRKGDRIPIGARIISVADAYEAMTSDRPYRKAMSHEEALFELRRCSGKQFDPEIVDVFVKSKVWR